MGKVTVELTLPQLAGLIALTGKESVVSLTKSVAGEIGDVMHDPILLALFDLASSVKKPVELSAYETLLGVAKEQLVVGITVKAKE